jgi:hypothetical protein
LFIIIDRDLLFGFAKRKDVPVQQVLSFVGFGFFLCNSVCKNQSSCGFSTEERIDF